MPKIVKEERGKAGHSSPRVGKPPDFKVLWPVDSGGKTDWREIGVAFAHSDATGCNVILQIIPIDGRFHLRAVAPPGIDKHATASGTDERSWPSEQEDSATLDAFCVLRDGKTWIKVGSAVMHRDRLGWSVTLSATPVDGYVILKEGFTR